MRQPIVLLAGMTLLLRTACPLYAQAVEAQSSISADETKLLTECFASIQPGDSTAWARYAPPGAVQFCVAWKGFSERATSNPDLDTDYINALGEFYSSKPRSYVECLGTATSTLAPWQKQQIYEAKVSERENRLYDAIDRKRIIFGDDAPARAVGNCRG